jgi:hypothetical protein
MTFADGLTRPLRTRERAAIDAARAALRKIALASTGAGDAERLAEEALERIAVLLGERE